MSYQLPERLAERVQQYVATGGFQSEEEVFATALDALAAREEEKLTRWNERNQIAIQQSHQGLARELDDEAVISRLHARLTKEGITE